MIDALLKHGVEFDRSAQEDPPSRGPGFDLGREGGHSRRRILHHRDSTGREIERALLAFAGTGQQQVICTFVMNRPEWDMVALASLYTGNVLFPLDTKMHDAEVKHLLLLSPPDIVLVSPASRLRMTRRAHSDIGQRTESAQTSSGHEWALRSPARF